MKDWLFTHEKHLLAWCKELRHHCIVIGYASLSLDLSGRVTHYHVVGYYLNMQCSITLIELGKTFLQDFQVILTRINVSWLLVVAHESNNSLRGRFHENYGPPGAANIHSCSQIKCLQDLVVHMKRTLHMYNQVLKTCFLNCLHILYICLVYYSINTASRFHYKEQRLHYISHLESDAGREQRNYNNNIGPFLFLYIYIG